MMWFDRADGRALFVDKRREECFADTREGRRSIIVDPDIMANFKALPFDDATFTLVVFDPPHTFSGEKGWMAKKYGTLTTDWREEIGAGLAECFRVLAPLGTLIFKWNEHRVPVSSILALTPEKPLFGQRCGTTAKTHWIVFMKQDNHPSGSVPPEHNRKELTMEPPSGNFSPQNANCPPLPPSRTAEDAAALKRMKS